MYKVKEGDGLLRNEIIMGYVSSKNVELYPEREFLPV